MKNIKISSINNNSTKLVIDKKEFELSNHDLRCLYYDIGQHLLRKEALK